jgi:predicted DCC family thiol-disulfide oxidoreductase YuxK
MRTRIEAGCAGEFQDIGAIVVRGARYSATMTTLTPAAGPLTVYVDGACDMCVGAARFAVRHDRAGRLQVRDLADADATVPARALLHALHVVDDAGTVFRGYDAVAAITLSAPRRRWLAPILGAAPVRWAGQHVYRLVARHRTRTSQT